MEVNNMKTTELQRSISELKQRAESLLIEIQANQESLTQEIRGFRAEYRVLIDFLIDQNVKRSRSPN